MKTKIWLIIALIVLLAAMSFADATTVTIELPDLVGELHQYPNGSVAVFDFGTSFLQIDEVRIQLTGTFTPGLAHGDGDELLEVPRKLKFTPTPVMVFAVWFSILLKAHSL